MKAKQRRNLGIVLLIGIVIFGLIVSGGFERTFYILGEPEATDTISWKGGSVDIAHLKSLNANTDYSSNQKLIISAEKYYSYIQASFTIEGTLKITSNFEATPPGTPEGPTEASNVAVMVYLGEAVIQSGAAEDYLLDLRVTARNDGNIYCGDYKFQEMTCPSRIPVADTFTKTHVKELTFNTPTEITVFIWAFKNDASATVELECDGCEITPPYVVPEITVYRLEENICTPMRILETERLPNDFDISSECEAAKTKPEEQILCEGTGGDWTQALAVAGTCECPEGLTFSETGCTDVPPSKLPLILWIGATVLFVGLLIFLFLKVRKKR